MADVTILPDGITKNSGWATNGLAEIDEGIAGADGSVMSTDSDGENENFTLDFASPGLSDGDTITQCDVIIRHGTGGVDTDSILDVAFLIGTVEQGVTQNPPNRTSLTNDTVNHSGWNTDWTAAQIDGVQLLITAAQTGMPAAERWDIDAIEIFITYTPAAANQEVDAISADIDLSTSIPIVRSSIEVPAADLALDEQIPIARPSIEVPDAVLALDEQISIARSSIEVPFAALALDEQIPTLQIGFFIEVPDAVLALDEQIPVARPSIEIPFVDLALDEQTPIARPSIEIPFASLALDEQISISIATLSIEVPSVDLDLQTFASEARTGIEVPTQDLALSTFAAALTISIPSQPQRVFPISDIAAGAWQPLSGGDLFAMLDETVIDDGDYIFSADNPQTDICEVELGDLVDPHLSNDHVISYRYEKENNYGQMNLIVRLMEGATIRRTWTHNDISNSIVQADQTLSGAEADSILDYKDLRLRFEATQVA